MLSATGGSGNYSWSITSQTPGLNLQLSASTGAATYLIGTPTSANTSTGLQITVLLTDTTTLLTLSRTYSIQVSPGNATVWTMSGNFADGGALSGTFALAGNTVSTWNLVATAGTTLVAFTYTPATSSATYSAAGDETCPGPCVSFTSNQLFPEQR